ncbi:hypothetical protein [Pseudomonas sp. CGJS7]|uniref:hypothetical protein n=1 Tax=Pseudomonas sp. CGJS7 TaxID=3109348 RepID=UPI003009C421
MAQRPDRFHEWPKRDPAAAAPVPPAEPEQAQAHSAEIAREQAALKRELARVYAHACGARPSKD